MASLTDLCSTIELSPRKMSNDARARLPRFRLLNIRSRYFRRYGLCRTAYEPLSFTSFLGLSVILCCAIFRVVRTCPSEVTSPLVKDTSFGGGIRTLMGSYPSAAMQLNPTFEYHRCTLLIRFIQHSLARMCFKLSPSQVLRH